MFKPAATLRSSLVRLREYFPFTLQGLAVLLLALITLEIFAYRRMDLVVFALAITALAILGFSLLSVIVSGLILRKRMRRTQAGLSASGKTITVEAGYPNETGYVLPTLAWLPLMSLDWQVVYPDSIETRKRLNEQTHQWEESIVPRRRCKTDTIVRAYTLRDVLGFCRFSWRVTQKQNLIALPQTDQVRQLPLLRSLTAEDGIPSPAGDPQGDRMEIRPYVPGDSVRNIMWTVYARNRHLNVRLAEKSVYHSNRTLAYLLSGTADEAAAAVARIAVESGALGEDWVFAADGSREVANSVTAALQLIAGSRALQQPHAYGLDDFLQQVKAPVNSHCIVFASARSGPWVNALRASVARFGGRFSVVLATDGLDQGERASLWQHLLFLDAEERLSESSAAQTCADSTAVSRLHILLKELGQFVESSTVVDRRTGLSFDQRLKRI